MEQGQIFFLEIGHSLGKIGSEHENSLLLYTNHQLKQSGPTCAGRLLTEIGEGFAITMWTIINIELPIVSHQKSRGECHVGGELGRGGEV